MIVNSSQLHDLVGVILVKRQASTGIDDLALRIPSSTKNQASVLGAFVVVENHPCLRTFERALFPMNDYARQPGMIGDHHSQRSIRLDHVDAVHRDLVKIV